MALHSSTLIPPPLQQDCKLENMLLVMQSTENNENGGSDDAGKKIHKGRSRLVAKIADFGLHVQLNGHERVPCLRKRSVQQ